MKFSITILFLPVVLANNMNSVDLMTAFMEANNYFQSSGLDTMSTIFVLKICEYHLFKTCHGIISDDSLIDSHMFSKYIMHGEIYKRHNEMARKGSYTYELGTNRYTVLDFMELKQLKHKVMTFPSKHLHKYKPQKGKVEPSCVDWRSKCSLLTVYDQGLTAHSWAYAVVEAIEAIRFLKTQKVQLLSTQELINCTLKPDTNGNPFHGLEYAKNSGILPDADFKQIKDNKCMRKPNHSPVKIKGFLKIPPNEAALQSAVSESPVIATLCCACTFTFHSYKTGTFREACTKFNHAVLVMGYCQDYWLIKNSFGPSWGENGYMKIARDNNTCGICSNAYMPLIS